MNLREQARKFVKEWNKESLAPQEDKDLYLIIKFIEFTEKQKETK